MNDLLTLTALTQLRALVATPDPMTPASALLLLKALQRRGLSRTDLVVHVERLRARNDATDQDEIVEENALLALDLIDEGGPRAVSWDAQQLAAAWVPLAIDELDLESASDRALAGNDLLPFNSLPLSDDFKRGLVENYWASVSSRNYEPLLADFFRAPKSGLTTRPAALLSPRDRFVYEALVEKVSLVYNNSIPNHVVSPRPRGADTEFSKFLKTPDTWDCEFVIRTDIANYYDTIDHAYLSVAANRSHELGGAVPLALESFLDAVMGSTQGLPQGPLGSDILASMFLLDIDREIDRRDWPISRYADDYLIGAQSFDEARARLRNLEAMLRDRGLTLASEKTRIHRRQTYLTALNEEGARDTLRERVRAQAATWFKESQDPRYREVFEILDLDEELQWGLFYHGSVSWEEALSSVDEQILPPWIAAYRAIYTMEARRLENGGYPSEPNSLTGKELQRCLVFMSADPKVSDLHHSHAVIDWHPSLVRQFSKFLTSLANVAAAPVGEFIDRRLVLQHDSDVELAWIVSPAMQNAQLAQTLRTSLTSATEDSSRPLTMAVSMRAMQPRQGNQSPSDLATIDGLSPALAAELALTFDWQQSPHHGPRHLLEP